MQWTARQLLKLQLATSVRLGRLSSSVKVQNTFPNSVGLWEDFEQFVGIEIAEALADVPDSRVFDCGPVESVLIASKRDALQALIAECLKRVQRLLAVHHAGYLFSIHPACEELPGEVASGKADAALCNYRCIDNPTALVAIECKQPCSLPDNTDLVRDYHDSRPKFNKVRWSVGQITRYIAELGTKYAVLSSFKQTFFIKAAQEAGGGIDLLVSRPIAWDAEDLTTTEGAFALSWRAIKEHTADGFGNGPRQATTLPAPRVGSHLMQLRQRNSGAESGGGSSGQTGGGGSRQDGSSGRGNIERVWSAQELDLGGRLGAGRDGIVKAGCFKGQSAAVKFMVPELAEDRASAAAAYNRELNTYMVLQDLQGGAIPCLLGTGYYRNRSGTLCPFSALERVVGCTLYDAEQPNQQQGRVAQHALRALHDRGVLRGDLRPENIMLTAADRGQNGVCLLDFASSSRSTAVDLQQAEELELAGLFSDKGITLDPLTPPLRKTSPRFRPAEFSDSD